MFALLLRKLPLSAATGLLEMPAPTSRQIARHHADPVLTMQEATADLSVFRRTNYDGIHKGIVEQHQKLGLHRVGFLRSTIMRLKASRPPAFRPLIDRHLEGESPTTPHGPPTGGTTASSSGSPRSGVVSFQRTDPTGRSSIR